MKNENFANLYLFNILIWIFLIFGGYRVSGFWYQWYQSIYCSWNASWTKWCRISICLVWVWKTGFLSSSPVPWLSLYNTFWLGQPSVAFWFCSIQWHQLKWMCIQCTIFSHQDIRPNQHPQNLLFSFFWSAYSLVDIQMFLSSFWEPFLFATF